MNMDAQSILFPELLEDTQNILFPAILEDDDDTFSPFLGGLLRESPHILFKREIEKKVNNIIYKYKKTYKELEEYLSNSKLMSVDMDNGKLREEELIAIMSIDVLNTLKNATEICITSPDIINTFMDYSIGMVDEVNINKLANFRIPFDEIVMTFSLDPNKYLETFLSVFKTKDYIDKNNIHRDVFCIKLCKYERNTDSKITLEFLYAPYNFNKIHCICHTKNCPNFIPSIIVGSSSDKSVCMKTVRNFDSCPINLSSGTELLEDIFEMRFGIGKVPKIKPTTLMFSLLLFVNNVLEVFYREPNKTIKVSNRKLILHNNKPKPIKDTENTPKEPHTIYLKDKVVYENSSEKGNGVPHTSHSSPCEHYRRPHSRYMKKSNKTITVQGSIVNKGNEKKAKYNM